MANSSDEPLLQRESRLDRFDQISFCPRRDGDLATRWKLEVPCPGRTAPMYQIDYH